MNRIVREHYPVSKLPEDLREGFGPDDEVRVTVDAPARGDENERLAEEPACFSRFKHVRRANYASMREIVDDVRGLRDEWTDRER